MGDATETRRFETETKQLLELMIHSLYSNKEVFLREIISNASDALDKIRFEAVTKPALLPDGFESEIRLEVNKEKRVLTIHDNGIGMSRGEVVSNIGTIARSGTQELLRNLKDAGAKGVPTELIGQFGVGFYSCFMGADEVVLTTRRAGEDGATVWRYGGGGEYIITEGSRDRPGTSIALHLKPADPSDGLEDFADEWVLRRIVKKYSDFVRYPVVMEVSREVEEDGKKLTKKEDETLNSMKAIWLKQDSDVTEEERGEFYKHISHDWTPPLHHIHMRAEGRLEYTALLFLPSHAPFDLFSQAYKRGLQLYVKNVKIMDHCEELLPEYLRFVKGVVDAADLPLNVSREMLQNNRQIASIRKALTKKVLDTLASIKKDEKKPEKYKELYGQFGAVLKEGVGGEPTSRDRLLSLVMFESTRDGDDKVTLEEYVSAMKDGQEEIYFLTGESRAVVESSPHLEAFVGKGFEVLFLTDPVDEFMVSSLGEFDGKKLRSVGQGEVDLGGEDRKEELSKSGEAHGDFLAGIQKPLDEYVSEVRLSGRLTDSPVCLVGDQGDISPHIERLMQQQKLNVPKKKRVLELNPDHPVIEGLMSKYDKDADEGMSDTATLLYGQALLAEASPLPDPAAFAALVAKLMVK